MAKRKEHSESKQGEQEAKPARKQRQGYKQYDYAMEKAEKALKDSGETLAKCSSREEENRYED